MFLFLWASPENRSSGDKVLELILNMMNINSADLSEKHGSPPHWLETSKRSLPITEAIIDAASENGQEMVQMFLRGPIIKNFDIEVIRDVMSSKGFQVDIDHLMIEAGVEIRLHGPEVLELLLSQMKTQIEITGKTVAMALGNDNASHRKELMRRVMSGNG